jgi:molecular chaperone GrpE
MTHEQNNHRKEPLIGPVTSLKAEFEKLQADVTRLKSDYLRSLAEFDNFRRRKDKEFNELQEYAGEKFLQEMIPLLDNFQRALQAAEAVGGQASGVGGQGSGVGDQGIRKGLCLIYAQFRTTLAKLGLEDYSCLGEQFDPKRCEAVGSVENSEQPEQTIVAETARGYVCKGRVLRPAMVMVAKGCQKSEGRSQNPKTGSQNSEAADGEIPGAGF